jgi:hypothetical protein
MPSFGEGFANAFNQGRMANNQRDASVRAFQTARDDRAAKLKLAQEKAQREAGVSQIKSYEEAIKFQMEKISNFIDDGKFEEANARIQKFLPVAKNFDEHASNLSAVTGRNTNLATQLEGMEIGVKKAREQRKKRLASDAAAKREPNFINFITPEGERLLVDENDPVAVAKLPKGTQRFSIAAAPTTGDEFTKTTKTQVQKQALGAANLATEVQNVRRQLREGTVGPIGFFKGLANRSLAAADPAFYRADRANLEQDLRIARDSTLRSISQDDRFNKDDRKAIEKIWPDLGFFESLPRAENALDGILAFTMRRIDTNYRVTDFRPKGILHGTSPEDVKKLFNQSRLTKEQALRAIETILEAEGQ